jgi:hypothetical protein
MIQKDKTIFAGIAGTTAMTLFSFTVSEAEKENFLEPALLAEFIKNAMAADEKDSTLAGWATHYGIGIGWAAAYNLGLYLAKRKPAPVNGLLFGAFSGATAILAWGMLFRLHPRPPITALKKFYAQLFAAHLVYGLGVSVSEKIGRNAIR